MLSHLSVIAAIIATVYPSFDKPIVSTVDCEKYLRDSQASYIALASSCFEMHLTIVETHHPPINREEINQVIAGRLMQTIADDSDSGDVSALAGAVSQLQVELLWELAGVRVTEREVRIVYNDGLWLIDDRPHRQFRRLAIGTDEVLEREYASSTDGRVIFLNGFDKAATITPLTDPPHVSLLPPGLLDHLYISTLVLWSFLSDDVEWDVIECRQVEDKVVMSLADGMMGQYEVSIIPQSGGAVSASTSTFAGAVRVAIERDGFVQYGDLYHPRRIWIGHYENDALSEFRLPQERVAIVEDIKICEELPNIDWPTHDGFLVRDSRTSQTFIYEYLKELRITEADRKLVSQLNDIVHRFADEGSKAPSCGSSCIAALAHLHNKNAAQALSLALSRERDGTLSLRDLREIAAEIDVPTRPVLVQRDNFDILQSPFIAHISGRNEVGHFVLCLDLGDTHVKVFDPLDEHSPLRVVEREYLENRFSGYALILDASVPSIGR